MVRLRREVEGVQLDPTFMPPAWGRDSALVERALPGWADAVASLRLDDGARVLVCGRPWRGEVARCLAAGARVTVADATRSERAALEALEGAAERLTIVDKPWGAASLGPSSFDAVLHLDRVAAYERTDWALKKLHRELKYDGLALIRCVADGPWQTAGADGGGAAPGLASVGASGAAALPDVVGPAVDDLPDTRLSTLLDPATRILRHPLAGPIVDLPTREAIDRGAHLAARGRFAIDASALLAALDADFTIERRWQGGADDLRVAGLLTGLAPRAARLLGRAFAGAHGAAMGERAVAVLARKPLGGRGQGGISWSR